jgi:hypothetical protein
MPKESTDTKWVLSDESLLAMKIGSNLVPTIPEGMTEASVQKMITDEITS